jgi:soluble lytic murein transglycosylase-like protein
MRRSGLVAVLSTLPSALSCACLSLGTPGPGREGLAAAPAAIEVAVAAEAPPAEETAPTPPEAAPVSRAEAAHRERVAEIAQLLHTRRTGLTRSEVARLAHTIVTEAERHALDPWLVLAVIAVESGFYNFAVSDKGAMGLMQVMPATGAELAEQKRIHWSGPTTLFDPIVNVRLGVTYLRQLSDRYGRIQIALAAYNWGPGRIDRRLELGTEVPQEYARLVLDAYDEAQARNRRS